MNPDNIVEVRKCRDDEQQQAAHVWYRAGKAEYTYLPDFQELTPQLAEKVFADVTADCEVWVALTAGQVVAVLAMQGSYVDRLYVDPEHQGCGIGRQLLAHARHLSPQGLELHTHQQNRGARRLYESEGFHAVNFGVSPAPELVPDVEYHWRP